MLYQLVQRLERQARSRGIDPRRVQIRVFDRQPVAGPGFPHNGRFVAPYHITNMCADEMSVAYASPRDFSDWVGRRESELAERFPALSAIIRDPAYHRDGCSHYPRALMGEYLAARFQDALRTADDLGMEVVVHTDCEVTNISDNERAVDIDAHLHKRGTTSRFQADQALLATGHWPRGGSGPGYFSSPWPADRLLEGIPPRSEVAVLGSSLSAIETALTLTSDGRFVRTESGDLAFEPAADTRRITMLSRRGLLPAVRARTCDYRPRLMTRQRLHDLIAEHGGNLTLDAIFNLVDREFALATGHSIPWERIVSPGKAPMTLLEERLEQARDAPWRGEEALWQAILRSMLPLVREMYLALSAGERRRFDRDYATLFFTHAATLPPINAEKMVALAKAGIASVIALGNDYRLIERPASQSYEFVHGEGASRRSVFHYLVDARGQAGSVLTDRSPLTRNLVRNRVVHPGGLPEEPGNANETASPRGETGEPPSASVRIDPETQRVMRIGRSGVPVESDRLFAVGAMTRGQIINVSMARALTGSTDRIARQIVNRLADEPRTR